MAMMARLPNRQLNPLAIDPTFEHRLTDMVRRVLEPSAVMLAGDPWYGPSGEARPAQLPPDGEWGVWLIMAGRGFGKTRSGAEWIRKRVQDGIARHVVIAGPTAGDVRDIMVEGESGLQAVCDRAGLGMHYEPSKRRITWATGATATLVSADEPNRFRGLNSDTFWADEIAAWRYATEAWDQMIFGHRIGHDPRGVATTTPRPVPLIRSILADVADGSSVITTGNTFENVDNLAPKFIATMRRKYEGTTLGRQELYAELIEEIEGALWQMAMIEQARIQMAQLPDLKRIVVAVDPATTDKPKSDQTGIAVVGIDDREDIYILAAIGMQASPEAWSKRVMRLYDVYEADAIIAESNQGGQMVRSVIRQAARGRRPMPRIRLIHAKRGKSLRAEPVAQLYEQYRVHHVGALPELEDQMVAFPVEPSVGDDLVDAVVHGVVDILKPAGAKARAH